MIEIWRITGISFVIGLFWAVFVIFVCENRNNKIKNLGYIPITLGMVIALGILASAVLFVVKAWEHINMKRITITCETLNMGDNFLNDNPDFEVNKPAEIIK